MRADTSSMWADWLPSSEPAALARFQPEIAALRALGLSLFRRRAFARLLAERAAIAAEIRSLRIAECRT